MDDHEEGRWGATVDIAEYAVACHLDRPRRTLSLSKGTEGEWRDREDACAAMLIRGVLSMPYGENALRQLLRCQHPRDLSTPRLRFW